MFTCSFASSLEIVCGNCDKKREKDRKEIDYLNKKIKNLTVKDKETKNDLRTLKLKRNNKVRFMEQKTLPSRSERVIAPVRNKKLSLRKRFKDWGKGSVVDYEINLRAMMAAFYCGTGADDIAKATSFIGIPGGKSWERSFSNYSPRMCSLIISVVNGVIKSSLEGEIKATIEEILAEKYSEEEIKKATQAFFAGDDPNIPDLIKKVGIAVSYDMGWQKRSTGKLYDSLSGHGFIFGVRTGNVIGYQVKSKCCSKCSIANSLNKPAEEHDCTINWEGSSGGMEAAVALELCIQLHDDSGYNIFVDTIVSDDDSTMRAHI